MEASIINFGSPAEDVSNLIKEGISFADMRTEIKRIKEKAQRLINTKNNLISNSLYSTDFDPGLEIRLRKKVIDETEKAQGIALKFFKDSNPVSTAATIGSTGIGGGASSSNTKKEAV